MALSNEPSGQTAPNPSKNEESNSQTCQHDDTFKHDSSQDDLPDQQLQLVQSNIILPKSLAAETVFVAIICSSQLLTQAGLAMRFSLTVGTFILIAGRLGDVFGHKRFFVAGFVWYGLWSALAGFAVYAGPIFFAFCRAMQGIGPAFLLPNSIAIIGRSYEPGSRQNMIFCLFGATAPAGFLLGAIFTSLLSQRVWWPWAYWIMCFVCLLQSIFGYLVIPSAPPPSNPEEESSSIWQRVDVFGSITGVAALILFNFAWNQGPVVGWTTPYTYALMIVGVVMFVAFVLVETRVRYPLIPFGVLKIDSFFTLACISAGWSGFGIFVLYTWNMLVVLKGQTPLLTSVQFVPVAISGLGAALATGLILPHFRASTVMLISMTAFFVGGVIFATRPVHQTYWAQEFVGIIVLPWGMDMSFPAATIVLSRAMPRRQQGLAASLVNTFVNYSISIGLGFAGTVDSQVNGGGRDILKGYRGALYMGVGLAGLGIVVALIFCFLELHRSRVSEKLQEGEERAEKEQV